MALRYAIIITLEDKRCSGYDIASRFSQGLGYFWSASHQQIYSELRKMTDLGLVAYELIEQKGKPVKKVYCVTEAGFKALDTWLMLPSKSMPLKDALLMKLYAGSRVAPDTLLREMQRHCQEKRQLLETYLEIDSCFQPVNKKPIKYQYAYLTLRKGIVQTQAWLQWSDEVCCFLEGQINKS